MWKFDSFSSIFDLATYRQNVSIWKKDFEAERGLGSVPRGKEDNTPLVLLAKAVWFLYRSVRKVKRLLVGQR